MPRIVADRESGVRPIELVRTITNDIEHPVLEFNRFVPINDDRPIIELIGNTDIAIRQLHRVGRQRSRVAARLRIGEVLEDDAEGVIEGAGEDDGGDGSAGQ